MSKNIREELTAEAKEQISNIISSISNQVKNLIFKTLEVNPIVLISGLIIIVIVLYSLK